METANTNYSQYPHGPPQAPSRVKYVTQGGTTYVTSNLLYPQSVIDRLHIQLREVEAQREAGALEINRLHREREERNAALEAERAKDKDVLLWYVRAYSAAHDAAVYARRAAAAWKRAAKWWRRFGHDNARIWEIWYHVKWESKKRRDMRKRLP